MKDKQKIEPTPTYYDIYIEWKYIYYTPHQFQNVLLQGRFKNFIKDIYTQWVLFI